MSANAYEVTKLETGKQQINMRNKLLTDVLNMYYIDKGLDSNGAGLITIQEYELQDALRLLDENDIYKEEFTESQVKRTKRKIKELLEHEQIKEKGSLDLLVF